MHLTVTSTVKNAPHSVARCVRSVQDQSHRDMLHVVICLDEATLAKAIQEAAGDPRTVVRGPVFQNAPLFANLLPVWRELPEGEPIVWLDGDDWLAVPHALGVINRAHQQGALVTYGQFLLPDGGMGFSRQVGPRPRREPWSASHLKTFRAGLVQRMRDEDFRSAGGEYAGLACDLRVMFGCLEMVPKRSVFISNALVVYNIETSFWANASPSERDVERREEARIRAMASYEELPESLQERLASRRT